jgi:predicted flap endonuclease-1-like 5' DNA nuclease
MATQTRQSETVNDANLWRARYEDERKRLAMLWKAFQDAERRIEELERQLAERTTEVEAHEPAPAAEPAPATAEEARPQEPPIVVEVEREEPLREQPQYPVGMYKIERVPGITSTELNSLREFGINLTDELLHTDLEKLGTATGIEREKLQRWRDVSEIMAINGIGPKWAVALVDAGVTSITQLASLTAEELERDLWASYERKGLDAKQRTLLKRTLPARSKKLIAAARKAAERL